MDTTVPVPIAIRVVWGSALLVVPGVILRLSGGADGARNRGVMRGLGVRHLLQAVAESRSDGTARKIGIGVDAIHAGTDIGFACLDRRWRRPAATDAAITIGFVLLGLITADHAISQTGRTESGFTLDNRGSSY